MDPDFGIDIEEMGRVFDEAEVVVVRFHVISQRLLIDARSAPGDPPMIRLVPPASSAEERYRYLQRERPGMPLPEQITVVGWPRYIQVMKDVGLWNRIEERLVREAGPEAVRDAQHAFDDVRSAERHEVAAAILGGEGYESLWERSAQR